MESNKTNNSNLQNCLTVTFKYIKRQTILNKNIFIVEQLKIIGALVNVFITVEYLLLLSNLGVLQIRRQNKFRYSFFTKEKVNKLCINTRAFCNYVAFKNKFGFRLLS